MRVEYLADHMDAVPILAGLFHKEWSHLYPETVTVREVARRIGGRANRNRVPTALVVYEDRELVGTVSLKVLDLDTRPNLTPWLAGLYVLKDRRGRGIGSLLTAAAEDEARGLGVEVLYLYTERSEGLYSRLGWGVVERTIYREYPVTIMSKALAG